MADIQDMILTTHDNPYSPHTQYELWRRWDIDNGYDTESLIARIADFPEDADETDNLTVYLYNHKAILTILENDETHMYYLALPPEE